MFGVLFERVEWCCLRKRSSSVVHCGPRDPLSRLARDRSMEILLPPLQMPELLHLSEHGDSAHLPRKEVTSHGVQGDNVRFSTVSLKTSA